MHCFKPQNAEQKISNDEIYFFFAMAVFRLVTKNDIN